MFNSKLENSLSEPLLSLDETIHEREGSDNDHDCMTTCSSAGSFSSSSSSSMMDEEVVPPSSAFGTLDKVILWIILPGLLVAQFYMAFHLQDPSRTSSLDLLTVNLCIGLFVATCTFYRYACHEAGITHCFILLLPELLMDVILGLVLFREAVWGFMALNLGMMALSAFVIVHDLQRLCAARNSTTKDDDITVLV